MNLPLGGKFTNQQAEHSASSWKTTEILIMNNIGVLLPPPSLPFMLAELSACRHAHLYYILRSFRARLSFYLFSNFLLRYLLWEVSNICKQVEKKYNEALLTHHPSQTIINSRPILLHLFPTFPSSGLFWNNSWQPVSFPSTNG